jgi:hypothetical protein
MTNNPTNAGQVTSRVSRTLVVATFYFRAAATPNAACDATFDMIAVTGQEII